ncbi:hypothetical protein [Actinoplanes sp. NPDC026619]|uniref:hypothetical protein n=1 Tax=Actinoplanes sp. NPDC026619 TaxID=3155798 RepID=UPI0033E5AD0B
MADVSLGETETDGAAEPEPDADGFGDAETGAGVGTGGLAQHPVPAGLVVRIGLAFLAGVVDSGSAAVVTAGAPVAAGSAGVRDEPGRATTTAAGPWPSPAFGVNVLVTAGRAGSVSAAAGVSFSSDPSPLTTPRYAPAAPATVSTPNPVTANTRGRRRGAGGSGCDGSKAANPPNVFIPVDVTSGPPDGGSTGRRPRS